MIFYEGEWDALLRNTVVGEYFTAGAGRVSAVPERAGGADRGAGVSAGRTRLAGVWSARRKSQWLFLSEKRAAAPRGQSKGSYLPSGELRPLRLR